MGLDIYVKKPIMATSELIELDRIENLPDDLSSFSITKNLELNKWKHFSFKKDVEYIDFEKTFKKFNINFDKYYWCMTGGKGYHFRKKENKHHIRKCKKYPYKLLFKWNELITFIKEEDYIIVDEVGYQRKGANKRFYGENEYKEGLSMWDSPPVVELNILLEHWEKYFSYETPKEPSEFGSGVEYHQADSEMKDRFKRNIIDNFVEGNTFVFYC